MASCYQTAAGSEWQARPCQCHDVEAPLSFRDEVIGDHLPMAAPLYRRGACDDACLGTAAAQAVSQLHLVVARVNRAYLE